MFAVLKVALLQQFGKLIVIGWIHWIVNVSNCKELWIARRNRREIPLIRKTGLGTTERERERHMDRKREKRGMQCYMKKEDNSLIDVENV